jgi:hypothetical protein
MSASPPTPAREKILSWLSNLFFILTALMLAIDLTLFFVPALVPAPLRPSAPTLIPTSTQPTVALVSTMSPTVNELPKPSPSPQATLTPSSTAPFRSPTPIERILSPTLTASITPTPTETATPTITSTPTLSPFLYTLQSGYPRYSAYPGGCNWLGFSGEVFDLQGQPVIDLVVHIGGVDHLVLSGSSQRFNIKGWVDQVSDRPANSNGFYAVQLQDAVGNPLSPAISLNTFNDCRRNLITVNFVQNH